MSSAIVMLPGWKNIFTTFYDWALLQSIQSQLTIYSGKSHPPFWSIWSILIILVGGGQPLVTLVLLVITSSTCQWWMILIIQQEKKHIFFFFNIFISTSCLYISKHVFLRMLPYVFKKHSDEDWWKFDSVDGDAPGDHQHQLPVYLETCSIKNASINVSENILVFLVITSTGSQYISKHGLLRMLPYMFSENILMKIGGSLMVLLVVFLVITSTSCLVVLCSYFSALPITKKNLVTR